MDHRTDVTVRLIEHADQRSWITGLNTGFLLGPPQEDHEFDAMATMFDIDYARTQGVFDRGRCVGTCRSTPRELTVPGGALLPRAASPM